METSKTSGRFPGFTLIELLIVVAIIAILAAIAVPNFLEAQTRAKVSASKGQMRNLGVALEAYRIDNPAYPPYPFLGGGDSSLAYLALLTTPISYITDAGGFRDPFWVPALEASGIARIKSYRYSVPVTRAPGQGFIYLFRDRWEIKGFGPGIPRTPAEHSAWSLIPYDPTNGTVSVGNLILSGPLDGNFGKPATDQQ